MDNVSFKNIARLHPEVEAGGGFRAHTSSRWGMIGLATNIIANSQYTKVLAKLTPDRFANDFFPTVCRMEALRRLYQYFRSSNGQNNSYSSNAQPPYVQKSYLAVKIVRLFWRLSSGPRHICLISSRSVNESGWLRNNSNGQRVSLSMTHKNMQNRYKDSGLVTAVGSMILMATAACAPAQEATVMPGGVDADDRAALQAAIDRTSAQGGGIVQLDKGVYNISRPVFMRSNVTLRGRGNETIITNEAQNRSDTWTGTTLFAGNLAPGSFADNDGKGYPGHEIRRVSLTRVEVKDCATYPSFKNLVGDIIWFASDAHRLGRGENERPVYGEMNRVEEIDGCQLLLADPINIPDSEMIFVHWSDGSKQFPPRLDPNRPIQNASVESLTLRSAQSQAMISTGCYKCSFTDLNIGRSRRLLGGQGMRHTVFRNITGEFWERGIEIVMFNQDLLVDGVQAKYVSDPASDRMIRPAIRFGEYARGTTVQNVTLDLGDAYKGKTKIRFDESSDNILRNITFLTASGDDGHTYFVKQGAGGNKGKDYWPERTVFDNVKLCIGRNIQGCKPETPRADAALP